MATCMKRCAVLDIETAPDDYAFTLSRRTRAAPRGSPIHEVINASLLTFVEAPNGRLTDFQLTSWHRAEYEERDILANLEAGLSPLIGARGRLVTFNGAGHDLPTLRRRQLRWWMCEAEAIDRFQAGDAEHLDIMLAMAGTGCEARWPTLADACASVGFSLLGPTPVGRVSTLPRETIKCELDVVGTAILMFYVLASRRRSREALENGLPSLGRFLRGLAPTRHHLSRFATSRLLSDDACAWDYPVTSSKRKPAPGPA